MKTILRHPRLWPLTTITVVALAFVLAGRATSLMQYLYPGQSDRTEAPTIPTLTLPLRVPSGSWQSRY